MAYTNTKSSFRYHTKFVPVTYAQDGSKQFGTGQAPVQTHLYLPSDYETVTTPIRISKTIHVIHDFILYILRILCGS